MCTIHIYVFKKFLYNSHFYIHIHLAFASLTRFCAADRMLDWFIPINLTITTPRHN